MQFSYGCMHFYILGLYQLFNFTKNDRVPRINEKFLNIRERSVSWGKKGVSVLDVCIYVPVYLLHLPRAFHVANPVGSTLYTVSHLVLKTTQGNKG